MANIRKLMVIQHDMPLIEIQRQLEENGIRLDIKYISHLRDKILRERAHRADRKALSYALAAFEDVLSETTKIAWQIALSNQSTRKERIAALKEIREAHRDVFEKLFDTGVFDRKLGVVEHKPKLPLNDEQRAKLIEGMVLWGIVKEEYEQLSNGESPDIDQKRS